MEIIRTISWMKEKAREARLEQRVIGFVPTMGALHAGHMALVERARQRMLAGVRLDFSEPDTVWSERGFVQVPATAGSGPGKTDRRKSVDGLFLPSAEEMYPAGFSTYVHVEGISERLEGKSRPGHFRGVATVC